VGAPPASCSLNHRRAFKNKGEIVNIRKIFRSKSNSNSVEGIVRKHKDIIQQKTELEKRAEKLKISALDADVDDLSSQLGHIRTELELCDSASEAVKKELGEFLEAKIQRDFDDLPRQQAQYKKQLSYLSQEAGAAIAKGIVKLQTLNLSFAANLAKQTRQAVLDFSSDHRFKNQMSEFLTAYGEAINIQSDTKDFKAWKAKLRKTEQLEPKSLQSQRHIEGQVKRLLEAN
jgi:hypothetical protein